MHYALHEAGRSEGVWWGVSLTRLCLDQRGGNGCLGTTKGQKIEGYDLYLRRGKGVRVVYE